MQNQSGYKWNTEADALSTWFGLYRVLLHPTVATFASQLHLVSWKRIGFLLGTYTLLRAGLFAAQMRMEHLAGSIVGGTVGAFIGVPVVLLLAAGLQFLLSRAWGGRGRWPEFLYATLLFTVPLGIIGGTLPVVFAATLPSPPDAVLATLATNGLLGVYGIVLNVLQIQASACLSRGRAIGVVLFSGMFLLNLGFLLVPVVLHVFSVLHVF